MTNEEMIENMLSEERKKVEQAKNKEKNEE